MVFHLVLHDVLRAAFLLLRDVLQQLGRGERLLLTLGEYQMLEVQMLQPSGAIDNHLFLFHPEKYYLLHISGNGTYYDFPALEKIAQNIEVVETGLHVDSYENKVNFILADLAAG